MTAETERLDRDMPAGKKPLIDEPLQVSYSKFSDGVKMVFLGVMEMLESIKPSQAKALVEPIISRDEPEKAAPEKGATDANETADATDAGSDAPSVAHADGCVSADDVPVEKKAPATTPAVTVDDITKVIVAKIKQKRSNNEIIGKLLTTYGAGKVSDLKPNKYEAFLTDLSQI